jgi:hypothetical protein
MNWTVFSALSDEQFTNWIYSVDATLPVDRRSIIMNAIIDTGCNASNLVDIAVLQQPYNEQSIIDSFASLNIGAVRAFKCELTFRKLFISHNGRYITSFS